MKLVLPLIAVVLLASSCSTAYKSGQTPDDVYFSPEQKSVASARENEYVQMDGAEDRQYRRNNRRQEYSDSYGYYDDRYLRMKVRNRRLWSDLDYYYSNPYAYRYYDPFWGGNFWGSQGYWNPYMAWGYYYNPYYRPNNHVIIVNPKSPVYNRPRTSNLNVFNRPNAPVYGAPRMSNGNSKSTNNRTYSQPREFGDDIRRTFGSGNNSSRSNSSFGNPSRSSMGNNSSSNSSSGGSSGGGRSGGNAPVRKF